MKKYESIYILRPELGEEETAALVTKFKDLVEEHGTMTELDEWGKRRLAYLIQKQAEGYYVRMVFEAPVDFPAELDRIYNITEGVMRSLIIAIEE